jgi:hypothetical protein
MTKHAAPLESPAEETTRLRECMSDLLGVMAVPALWVGGRQPDVVSRALDVLRDRTSELIAANDRLANELAECRQTEETLRANELNFRLTVDNIPGMDAGVSAP